MELNETDQSALALRSIGDKLRKVKCSPFTESAPTPTSAAVTALPARRMTLREAALKSAATRVEEAAVAEGNRLIVEDVVPRARVSLIAGALRLMNQKAR